MEWKVEATYRIAVLDVHSKVEQLNEYVDDGFLDVLLKTAFHAGGLNVDLSIHPRVVKSYGYVRATSSGLLRDHGRTSVSALNDTNYIMYFISKGNGP